MNYHLKNGNPKWIYFPHTGSNLFRCFLCFSPGKGINFKTFHVQMKELNDIVLATPNQTMRGRNKDDCKWISLFVLKRELSASDLR